MANPSKSDPPLYEARTVPFEKLSAEEFEKCVFACFLTIQSHQGLRIDGSPTGSGDGGFDVDGIEVNSKRKLCIQCKRQNKPLGLPLLAKELAKVALTSRLENSDVGVHFFICTGGVTQKLRRILRGTVRVEIINAAQLAIRSATKGELHVLRERLTQKEEDAEEVVGSYVQRLDRLVAWGIDEFDAALSPAWDEARKVLDRYFTVATTVREYPRALFDRGIYQEKNAGFRAVVQPQLKEGALPAGLVEISGEDPGPKELPARKKLLTVKSLATLAPGEAAFVVGEGGAGKSTLLKLVRAEVAKEFSDSALSILINCAEYEPGGLDAAMHAQLGVKSGSWRTLPDKIQILCDGINEAPTHKVKALFSELKPLLASNAISCIFTSREDSRAVRIVLPTVPCTSLRLLPLTPGNVRTLAQHELAEHSDIAAFTSAHRTMATRAGGPFMWTPFSVRVALERWKNKRQLGNTLGELLDEIVAARADRDLEIAPQDSSSEIPRTSVLAMASAMAFEMLVIDGNAACSASTIGAIFRRAMCLCPNVLGSDGLSCIKLVDLLRKHDLVQQTPDESFQWKHQLVAGALAAQHLASQWRRHRSTFHQTIADDAWVFAIRAIPELDLDEYLCELFRADLMLGARATAELPLEKRDRSLQYIFKALESEQSEALQVAAFFALARVGTERALSTLKKMAANRESDVGFLAAEALAYSGDQVFLLKLLEEVDQRRQIGWSMSGGEISIWESASIADRIAIARERLMSVTPGEPVNESLHLVSMECSIEDIPLLEVHLRAAKDITAWGVALRAISCADRDCGQSLLEETLAQEKDRGAKAEMMKVAHELKLFTNVEAAFHLLMELSNEDSSGRDLIVLTSLVSDLLGKETLPSTIRDEIEDQLPSSSGKKKSILWQIAVHAESSALALIALDTFDNDPENVGMAANFFISQEKLCIKHRDAIQPAIERFLANKINWFSFESWRALELATKLGVTARTAELLESMILRLTELRELVEAGMAPMFEESEKHFAKCLTTDSSRYELQRCASFIVSGAAGAKGLIPTDLLLKFLHFDLGSSAGKEIANVYQDMDSNLLDDELESVRDPWAQRAGLEMLCEFGLTDRRLALLRTHLRAMYCHPSGLGGVKRALEKCWNNTTCTMVVETITGFEEWPQEWHQFFWDFTHMVGARLSSADRSVVERHIPLAKTAFAQRILKIWRQATLESRVGLSRLDAWETEQIPYTHR